MTAKELKKVLHENILRFNVTEMVMSNRVPVIYVSHTNWLVAKYACTTEEKDFSFVKGVIYFQGIRLVKI